MTTLPMMTIITTPVALACSTEWSRSAHRRGLMAAAPRADGANAIGAARRLADRGEPLRRLAQGDRRLGRQFVESDRADDRSSPRRGARPQPGDQYPRHPPAALRRPAAKRTSRPISSGRSSTVPAALECRPPLRTSGGRKLHPRRAGAVAAPPAGGRLSLRRSGRCLRHIC